MASRSVLSTLPPLSQQSRWRFQVEEFLLRYGLILLVLAGWQFASSYGFIDSLFVPAPAEIVRSSIPWYVSGRIWPFLCATASAIILGLIIATVLGLFCGIALGRYQLVSALFNPLLTIAYAIPVVAFGPTLGQVVGSGITVPVILIVGLSIFPVIFTVAAGIKTARRDLTRMAVHFGANEFQIVRDILVPASMPYLIGALRVSIGRAVAGAVVGEWLSGSDGLGSLMFSSAAVFETKTTFMATITLVGLSLLLTWAVRRFDRWYSAWNTA